MDKSKCGLDLENLIEEIKDMGTSEENHLENVLIILFEHILKCQYQPEMRTGSWDGSIREQRFRARKRLKKSPSLKPMIPQIAEDAYQIALIRVSQQTKIPRNHFPREMPFSFQEAMRDGWIAD
jgi:hypothetical protein